MNDKLREHFGEYFDCPMGFVDQKIMELVNEYFDKIPDYFWVKFAMHKRVTFCKADQTKMDIDK